VLKVTVHDDDDVANHGTEASQDSTSEPTWARAWLAVDAPDRQTLASPRPGRGLDFSWRPVIAVIYEQDLSGHSPQGLPEAPDQ
jgi:hypothetical protein